MNNKFVLFLFLAICFIINTKLCFGKDLLANASDWYGDVGFSISNKTVFLIPNKKIIGIFADQNFISGKTYKISFDFEWEGDAANHPHDFFLDLYLNNGIKIWDDHNYNFIPSDDLRQSGKHKYFCNFKALDIPENVSLRIIKLGLAKIKINNLRIEKTSEINFKLCLLYRKIFQNEVGICISILVAFQFFSLIFILIKFKILEKRN